MPQLVEQFRITESNLNARKSFITLDEADVRILASLKGWADRVSPKIAREFYDHQFAFDGTRKFFDAHASQRGIPVATLRTTLEGAQAGYFRQIFEEAAGGGNFGTDYFERRLHVGSVHNVIDLPMKWYLGSYTLYQDLTRKYLRQSFRFRPGFRRRAESAIFKIFNYDMQAVADAFFLQLLTSLGFDLGSLEMTDPAMDVSECFRTFKSAVRNALTGMLRAGDELTTVGQQIAAASQSVSSSVQQQAASLEETSASLEEITTSVKQNASNAQRANQLATGGATDADKTNSVIQQMTDITTSSRQIESIISMINEIAFQTNLLALNAAVEAARAGEHGRGFAVVASEVGNLAQRSASAAKEIGALIQDSVRKVEAGTASVKSVTELVSSISIATAEQARGIDQVSIAVRQMDQGTQANAAQSEELNATAEQLSQRAGELRELLQYFKIESGGSSGGPPGRPAAGGRRPRARAR